MYLILKSWSKKVFATVTGTGVNGCSATASATITANPLMVVTISVSAAACSGVNATIFADVLNTTVTGYLWAGGATTQTRSVPAGTYTATVTDANGCSATASVTLTQPAFTCTAFYSSHVSGFFSPLVGQPGGLIYQNFLNANFAGLYANGLVLSSSCGTYTLSLTSAQAALAFMPSNGIPGSLTQNWINPLPANLSNALAAQLVGLNLNICFDKYDANWAPSNITFDQLVVDSGPLTGLTVAQVYQEGVNRLTGCGSVYPASTLRTAIASVNSSWYLGQKRNTIVKCPSINPPKMGSRNSATSFELNVFPNPANDKLNLSFESLANANCHIKLMDMTGKIIIDELKTSFDGLNTFTYDLETLPRGIYMVQFIMGNVSKQARVVIQ